MEGFEDLTVSNYSHFNQPLAHPLGANFTEFIFQLRYQPTERIIASARYLRATQGRTATTGNMGEDLLLNNGTRTSDFNQAQNQGVATDINLLRVRVAYEISNRLFIDLEILLRDETSTASQLSSSFIGTGLRYNIGKDTVDF